MAAIGIALIMLVLFGQYVAPSIAAAYRYAKANMPTIGNPLTAKVEIPLWKALLLVVAFGLIASGGGGWSLPEWKGWSLPSIPFVSTKATAATYVYEKDQGGIPAAVMSGLNKLNTERKITATALERDTKNGNQQIPEQYKVAVGAAKELPSLVATAGTRVLKVTKAPKTEDDVLKGVP